MVPNGCEKTQNEKLSMVNQWIGRLRSETRMKGNKCDVLRDVWKSVAVLSIQMVWKCME